MSKGELKRADNEKVIRAPRLEMKKGYLGGLCMYSQ